MKKNRTKLINRLISTKEEVEAAATRYADAALSLRTVTAWRDQLILEANEKYGADIARYTAAMEAEAAALGAWAMAHPEEFQKRRSLDLACAVLGFRTSPPKVALAGRAWTWEKVLSCLRLTMPQFIRTKAEVDKEAILSAGLDATTLSACGLRIAQSEQFFIEAKLSEPSASSTQST